MMRKQRADISKAFKVLEDAIENKEAQIKEQLSRADYPDYVNNLVSNSFHAVESSVDKAEEMLNNALTVAERLSVKAKGELNRDPWGFLGKVALGGIGLGLILGSRYRNRRSRARK